MASTLAYSPHVKGSDVTNETLTKMRTDPSFDHCARLVGEPTLPRKRRAPARLEVGVGAPELFPQTAKDHLQGLLILSSVLSISALIRNASAPTPRWTHMETLLVKAANGDDYEAEFKYLEASYSNDVDSLGTADGVFSPRSLP